MTQDRNARRLIATVAFALAILSAPHPAAAQQSSPRRPGDDSCEFAKDGECDEPGLCPRATDTTDCRVTRAPADPFDFASGTGPNSCPYAGDGECDEPGLCDPGTDTADCRQATPERAPLSPLELGVDSCRWARDGTCDQPPLCAVGTDITDCRLHSGPFRFPSLAGGGADPGSASPPSSPSSPSSPFAGPSPLELFGTPMVLAFGLLPVVLWAKYRWRTLGPKLFPDEVAPATEPEGAAAGVMSTFGPDKVALLLAKARLALLHDPTPDGRRAADVIAAFESLPDTARVVRSVIAQSLDTSDVSSMLIASNGVHLYAVAVPNRHDSAHLMRRYAPFAGGWRSHFAIVRASMMKSGEFRALVSLLFFLSPEGRESVLLVSYADAGTLLVSSSLLDASQLGAPQVTPFDATYEFNLGA